MKKLKLLDVYTRMYGELWTMIDCFKDNASAVALGDVVYHLEAMRRCYPDPKCYEKSRPVVPHRKARLEKYLENKIYYTNECDSASRDRREMCKEILAAVKDL
jgi:hypothetical protein